MVKIATWNVNSVRARLDHVRKWLSEAAPDVLALQETKVQDADFPRDAFTELGYGVAASGQRSYNGVAVLSREPARVVATTIPGLEDQQRRVLGVELPSLYLLNLYVPNGAEVESDKFAYKLDWLDALIAWSAKLVQSFPRLVIVGDFNIAPDDRDVYDPDAWRGKVLCSEPERTRLAMLKERRFEDVFRRFDQPAGAFSWWDYRGGGFRRNLGLRIDLVLASAAVAGRCLACSIDREPRGWDKPSDHAPVTAIFDI